jgi:DNA polymerase-3 subunit epsilon
VGCESVKAFLKQERFSQNDFHRRSSYNRYQNKSVRLSEVTATVEQFDLSHPLYQKTLVFTGDLSIDRAEAVQLAVNKGALVKSGVSGKTQVVVLGRREEGAPMSSKEKRARELIAAGKEIRLLEEEEFLALVRS